MAEPSIAMIPSGYKAEKIYSVLPTNGNADLDFARNSKATRINEQGLIEEMAVNVPLLDYSDGTCPSLLLQPQSTNLIQYSEDFNFWSKEATVILTDGYGTSPNGSINSTRVQLEQNDSIYISTTSGNTFSIYIKGVKGEKIRINNGDSLTHTLSGEWDRASIYNVSNNSNLISINTYGGVSINARDIEIWGGQSEPLSFATSYIKTEGSTQTRLQDTASKSGLENEINSEEGVFYAQIENKFPNTTTRGWNLQSSLNNGSDLIAIIFSTSQRIVFYLRANGVTTINQSVVNSYSGFIKIALKYKSGDSSLWINGVEVSSSATTFSFSNPLSILGNNDGLGGIGYFGLKDSRVYKIALTDAQLTTLTTI